jgi:TnpA family transposase
MEYCTVHNSTDDATFAAQKKSRDFAFYLSLFYLWGRSTLQSVNCNRNQAIVKRFTPLLNMFPSLLSVSTVK